MIAIGNFDGLHLGHQKVIKEAKQKAQKNKIPFKLNTELRPLCFLITKLKITE